MFIDYENKKCLCCDMTFKLNSDLNRHIASNKHVKNLFNIDKTSCPFCDYKSDDISNMNKHLKNQHSDKKLKVEEKAEKEFKDKDIPNKIVKLYITLKEKQSLQALKISGLKCRYNRLRERFYKEDEQIMIETKTQHKLAITEYKSNNEKLETLLKEYPLLIEKVIPPKNLTNDINDDKEEEEQKKEMIEKENFNSKYEKLDKIKEQIKELQQKYINSKGDKTIAKQIVELENEFKSLA